MNPTRLIIAGAGGFGRAIFHCIMQSPKWRSDHRVESIAFIDDNTPSVQPQRQIISTIAEFTPDADDLVLCAIGSPHARRAIVAQLAERGTRFVTFVDDRAYITGPTRIGTGSIVLPGAYVSAEAHVGEHCQVNLSAQVSHDSVVEDYVTVSPGAIVNGSVTLRTGAFIGAGAILIPSVEVGRGSVIGAGAVVTKSVPAMVLAAGNPCVVKRELA